MAEPASLVQAVLVQCERVLSFEENSDIDADYALAHREIKKMLEDSTK